MITILIHMGGVKMQSGNPKNKNPEIRENIIINYSNVIHIYSTYLY